MKRCVEKVYHLVGNPPKCPSSGASAENSGFRRCTSRFFFMGLHEAAPDGVLLRFQRRYTSGSRDLVSPATTYKWTCRAASRAITATVLETRGMALEWRRATARAARNGCCAASKTRVSTCQAQTAMASSHRAASWIEG